jgi:uncharacterized delta-60 repeat protein
VVSRSVAIPRRRLICASALTVIAAAALAFAPVADAAGPPVAFAVAIDASGRVLAAGEDGNSFVVLRHATDGSLDPTFGSRGMVVTHFGRGGLDRATSMAIDRSGRIVVAGQSCCSTTMHDILVARYLPSGSLDPSFGRGGKVTVSVGAKDNLFNPVATAIDPSGRIVVAGTDGHSFVLLRFTATGNLDPTFGSGGEVKTVFALGPSSAVGVAIEPSGKIVAAGMAHSSSPNWAGAIALARYTSRGTLDPTFGAGGEVTSDFEPATPGTSGGAFGVALDSSQRIVVIGDVRGGSSDPFGTDFAVARYNPDGTRDTAFGNGGTATADFNPGVDGYASDDQPYGVAIDAAGRIVVAGDATNCPSEPCAPGLTDHMAIARFTPVGTLDGGFGNGGRVMASTTGNADARGVAVDGSGGIAVAGANPPDLAVARFAPDGTPDPDFGGGAVVTTPARPLTWITSATINSKKRSAGFRFDESGLSGGFDCRLVSASRPNPAFRPCLGPTKAYTGLKPGRYTFEVRSYRVNGPEKHPARWPFGIAP